MKKTIVIAMTAAFISSPLLGTTAVVFADQQPPQRTVIDDPGESSSTVTLAEVSSLSASQKQVILEETLAAFRSRPTPRGRYFKSHKVFSRAQVAKISQRGYTSQALAALLPGPLKAGASLIYGSYYKQFHTAARNGWGVRITLTVDSYNPTSTGMSWSASYVK